MSHHRYSEESRLSTCITPAIIEGRPWIARHISNNNLRQHCRLLGRTFSELHPQTNPIREYCSRLAKAIEGKSNLLTGIHPSDFPTVPVTVRIAAYHHRWIRQPETWPGFESTAPRDVLRDLLQHLFAHWKTPECFNNAWFVKGELSCLDRDWYCHLASGGSLRNAQGMPPTITSRALHLAMNAPSDLTIRQALRWGQIKALHGSDELLAEVISSNMATDLSNHVVWSRLFEKLVVGGSCYARHFGMIADTLLVFLREQKHRRAGILVDLPTDDLVRHCQKFWKSILRMVQLEDPDWARNDIDCPHLRRDLVLRYAGEWASLPGSKPFESVGHHRHALIRCTIVELTQPWQLIAESQAMKHCVDTYIKSCQLGRCSIFSVRTDKVSGDGLKSVSHLTIEVERRSRKIIQVRGRRNQYVDPRRVPLLQQWANELKLVV